MRDNINIMAIFLNVFLISYIVFFPTYIFGSTSGGQIALFVSFPALLFLIVTFKSRFFKVLHTPIVILVVFIFGAVLVFTFISKVDFIDYVMLLNHLRFVVYAAIIAMSFWLNTFFRLSKHDLKVVLCIVFFIILLFLVFQFFSPNNIFVQLVTKRVIFDYTGFRVGGPFDWSYIFAFCSIGFVFIFFHGLARKENTFFFNVVGFLTLVVFFLSQSKAAYLSFFVICFLFFVFNLLNYKYNKRLIYAGALIFLSVILFIFLNLEKFSHFLSVYSAYQSGGVDASTQTRLNQLNSVWFSLDGNFLFGYPLHYLIIENAYGHYVYNYGIVGLFGYISLFFILLIDSVLKLLKVNHLNEGKDLGVYIGFSVTIFSIFIFSLASSPVDANKSSYFFFFLYGCYLSVYKTEVTKL